MQPVEYLPYAFIVLAMVAGLIIARTKRLESYKQFAIAMYGSIAVIVVLFWLYFFFLHAKYAGAGNILQIYGATGKQGDAILIHNTGHSYIFRGVRSYPPHRLDILDPVTGNKMNRAVLGDISDAKVLAIDRDKIWYDSYQDKLHARNYYSAEIVVSQKDSQVKALTPLSAVEDTLDGPGGGNYVRLPADTTKSVIPKATAYDTGNPDWFFYSDGRDRDYLKSAVYPQIPIILNPLKEDPNVFRITKIKLNRHYGFTLDSVVNPRLAFRQASFLQCALAGGIPVTSKSALKELYRPKLYVVGLHNPESVFITSVNFDANRQQHYSLSRVTLAGQVLWTINESTLGYATGDNEDFQNYLNSGDVISAFGLYKNMLILGARGVVISLDINTGMSFGRSIIKTLTAEIAKNAKFKMNENEISKLIVDAAFQIHKELGPGLLESAYEACLIYELSEMGLGIESQKAMPVKYKNKAFDAGYRIDLLIEQKVIVEIKAVEILNDIHLAQILTYLKLSECKLGLLINFNTKLIKNGIRRVVNNL